ncbi:MarR family transcriptional regulator [Virgibacillus pantothenticus]|uniref:HTH-type transcriptional regulator MgrA n=1 Tax=Virgibacillus pantothenticus TaxID=1473 RepID=A0A0L0QMB0_VIRPA|nr:MULTISPECIES: MarR family transcriptional regulator [Virgibacillus]API93107.1 MarR family transcriptional regulator [Virgibacillus sp. 6R]KNE19403.1 MarR family transcriptional regulator [Virgibacillus pantothenticus]MBS7428858.1 MarR family transcriptional regulator [Virgibacillus sp. 19R1-5]MBU8568435.1 MarR family transcriptional regulator [Virgibacillus pantothenticus]MBU8602433.1 MarR family transcriptional regulator [Virgibacillus pantothenticus]
MIDEINRYFTNIYFELHPIHQEAISHQSVRILQVVDKKQFVMIRDIAEHLSISHNTASEHVKRLVSNGWLYKKRYEKDQRKVYLHLTELGVTVLKKNTELDEKKLQAALDKLSDKERIQVVKAFQLLNEVTK